MDMINCLLNTRTLIILSLGAYPSQAAAACTHAYAHCAAYAVDADASIPEQPTKTQTHVHVRHFVELTMCTRAYGTRFVVVFWQKSTDL